MTNKIDEGTLIYQETINVQPNDTVDTLYQKSFAISAGVTLVAQDSLDNNSKRIILPQHKKSYFSFPTKEEWRQFRSLKKRFI